MEGARDGVLDVRVVAMQVWSFDDLEMDCFGLGSAICTEFFLELY